MHMRPRRPASGAEEADFLMKLDLLAECNGDAVQMCVPCADVMAVFDLDHEAVGAVTAGEDDAARGGRRHRHVQRRPEIDPFVHRLLAAERIGSAPERAGDREILERRRERHGAQEPGQGIEACDVWTEGIGRG